MIVLTACGSETAGTPDAAAPAAPASAAPESADVELCRSANLTKQKMLVGMTTGLDADGKMSPKAVNAALTEAAASLTTLARSAGNSPAATAVGRLGKEIAKAIESKDPVAALDSPAFTKAGRALDTACARAGV
jgi:hypothetical protein